VRFGIVDQIRQDALDVESGQWDPDWVRRQLCGHVAAFQNTLPNGANIRYRWRGITRCADLQ
jgi:hypothetical protein